jgi:hypothetical protein
MSRRLLPLLLLLACNDPSEPPLAPVVTVSPAIQWSGGEVQLTSEAFAGSGLPLLLVGAETLAVRRLSDSVVAAVVPLGSSGVVQIDLKRSHTRLPVGAVTRVGFRGTTSVAPSFYGGIVVSHNGSTPMAVGEAITTVSGGRPVQVLDLSSMLLTTYPLIHGAEFYGVSPTSRPNEFVVLDSMGLPYVWQLWPTPALIDSPPKQVASSPIRQLPRLSDSVWVRTGSHSSTSWRGLDSATAVRSLQIESPWTIYISPRGDLATFAVSLAAAGVPVFNTVTGDTVYTLGPGFRFAQAAAFSSDGALIFFLGGVINDPAADSLIVVRASTGEVLAGTKLPAGTGFNLAADPSEPLLYVETLIGGRPTILVYAQNLALLGQLPAPADGTPTCDYTCPEGAVAVDRSLDRLHVVWESGSNYIWTYDLLPRP